jgi:hypothetical protein
MFTVYKKNFIFVQDVIIDKNEAAVYYDENLYFQLTTS